MVSVPLVGRDGELASIAEVMERARSGSGGTLFAIGEGGFGKSAVIRCATDGASDLIEGRAVPPPAPALRPLVELASARLGRGARVDDASLRVHQGSLRVLVREAAPGGASSELPAPLSVNDALLALAASVRCTASASNPNRRWLRPADVSTQHAGWAPASKKPGPGT